MLFLDYDAVELQRDMKHDRSDSDQVIGPVHNTWRVISLPQTVPVEMVNVEEDNLNVEEKHGRLIGLSTAAKITCNMLKLTYRSGL